MKTLSLLFITGQDAYPQFSSIHWQSIQNKYSISIRQIFEPISAFISQKQMISFFQQHDLTSFDLIMISGMIPWSVSDIQSYCIPKIIKGPQFVSQILPLLQNLSPDQLLEFSGDGLNLEHISQKEYSALIANHQNSHDIKSQYSRFSLPDPHSSVLLGSALPPLVLGEVVDFPRLSDVALFRKIDELLEHGADLIDLGCILHEPALERIAYILPLLQQKYSIPFCLDSTHPKEIKLAASLGISMILSITPKNIADLHELPKHIPIVITTPPQKTNNLGYILKIPGLSSKFSGTRFSSHTIDLIEFYLQLSELGFQKILIDPIVHAPITPGFTASLREYWEICYFIDEFTNAKMIDGSISSFLAPQLMMGIGNVLELVDGDSSGMITLLAAICQELGVGAVLLPEHSGKCFASIKEFNRSKRLMFVAAEKKQPPLNIGLDAFQFKSKGHYLKCPFLFPPDVPLFTVDADVQDAIMDPKGYFKIYVSRDENRIIVAHYQNSVKNSTRPNHVFSGIEAESIVKTILDQKLVSRLDHAAYLGRELQKAEEALRLGSPFVQS